MYQQTLNIHRHQLATCQTHVGWRQCTAATVHQITQPS